MVKARRALMEFSEVDQWAKLFKRMQIPALFGDHCHLDKRTV
jgi:hypothetical protein